MRALRIVEERIDSEVGAQWTELMDRYGLPHSVSDGLAADHLAPPDGVFLVAWDGDVAVGCGGLRKHDPTTAEIKRMYTAPRARRQGISRAVLHALEERAREMGYHRVVLETGTAQPEAIALYERAGYTRIPGYGAYRDTDRARCYGKDLA